MRKALERAFPPPATMSMNDMPGLRSGTVASIVVSFTNVYECDAVKTFLRAEVFPFDHDFLARLGFVRFHARDFGPLAAIADRIFLDHRLVRTLDRFHFVECEAGAVDDGAGFGMQRWRKAWHQHERACDDHAG